MSAILGIFYLDGQPVDPGDLHRMVASLAHRGPDRQAIWFERNIGLGHCMFSTTPESLRECLPLVHKSSEMVLTADARLDNREELIAGLEIEEHLNTKIPDSELILAAYLKWGEDCPNRLLGDFSFALWDGPKGRLFCARDIASVKPFYYYSSENLFAFASEYKALLCLPEVPRRLNEIFVADYLSFTLGETGLTIYQDIMQLPGAHTITVEHQDVGLRRYWSLDPYSELRLGSEEEYFAAFREIFSDAVRCRLRATAHLASMLSGGLDSSSIVCVARRFLGSSDNCKLHTISAVFPGIKDLHPRSDERQYMQAVARIESHLHHYINIEKMSSLSDKILFEYDHIPQVNMYLDWSVFQEAKALGARVVLSGTDGDTIVGYGLSHLEDLFRLGKWFSLARETHAFAMRVGRARRTIFKWYVLDPVVPIPIKRFWRLIRRSEPSAWDARSMIRPEFASKVRLEERIRERRPNSIIGVKKSREAHWQDLTSGLWPNFLEASDDLAAAVPVEVRYPFFDRRLIEFCLALPGELKLKNGWTRYILRGAMDGILPAKVQWRTWKGNFGVNTSLGLYERSKDILDSIILGPDNLLGEYIDMQGLQVSYKRFLLDPAKYVMDGFLVFWNAALEICLRNSLIEMDLPTKILNQYELS